MVYPFNVMYPIYYISLWAHNISIKSELCNTEIPTPFFLPWVPVLGNEFHLKLVTFSRLIYLTLSCNMTIK